MYGTEESKEGAAAKPQAVFHTLRQQAETETDGPNLALADFVAPKDSGIQYVRRRCLHARHPRTGGARAHSVWCTNRRDYIGCFAVAMFGAEAKIEEFMADHDDYSKIMLQALADRLAEAYAELLHARIRTSLWGYSRDESLEVDDLIKIKCVLLLLLLLCAVGPAVAAVAGAAAAAAAAAWCSCLTAQRSRFPRACAAVGAWA